MKSALPRRPMGPSRLAFIACLIALIFIVEYNWITTPWLQKTLSYCRSFDWRDSLLLVTGWFE
ncbi:hypothetical protein [Mesorhizobium sp. L48C026A00]|uniref:hypothetical protein n=1 Tax=Mesorhizobium sp. L48C026A00 TaxID=1287182 RepID=UPI0004CFDF3B|nr:hypothetical protein [Mesorhizobium sp. L48C026A00]